MNRRRQSVIGVACGLAIGAPMLAACSLERGGLGTPMDVGDAAMVVDAQGVLDGDAFFDAGETRTAMGAEPDAGPDASEIDP